MWPQWMGFVSVCGAPWLRCYHAAQRARPAIRGSTPVQQARAARHAGATTLELAHPSKRETVCCARLQGQEDPPLNARGVLQAAALAAALQGVPLGRIYTSDLRRALHTAQAVASALGRGQDAVVALPSLRERHLGILQARRAGRPLMLTGSRCCWPRIGQEATALCPAGPHTEGSSRHGAGGACRAGVC